MNIEKVCVCFCLALLFFLKLQAQEAEDKMQREGVAIIPEAYDRSSISLILVYQNGDPFSSMLIDAFRAVNQSEKFFVNPLSEPVLRFRNVRHAETNVIHQQHILQQLNENQYPREIISFWYNRKENGLMDMELIHKRGMMNATVEEVMRNQATTRGNLALMDYGNRLIERSYIIALDFTELKRVKADDYEGFSGQLRASLFRINLSEAERGLIYDAWVLPGDSREDAAAKQALYNQLSPDLQYITSVSTSASAYNYKEHTFLGQITSSRSDDQLIASLTQRAYDQMLTELERNYTDFNVVTPLHSVRPLAARIGKKEGLRVDQRFFVYEHRYDRTTGQIVETRRGVIRAGSEISDNRGEAMSEMEPSIFYQTSGRRLQEGFVLQQQNDLGIELRFDYSNAEMGGFTAELGASVGRFFGIPAFYLSGMVGFDAGSYDYLADDGQTFAEEDFSFLQYGISLAKGYHFVRNFEIRPHFGVFLETARNEDLVEEEIQGIFLNAGGSLGIHLAHYMQLVAGYNQHISIGNASFGDEETELLYTDIFPGRDGGSPFFGIRFIF